MIIWLYGLSGAGKSTIAKELHNNLGIKGYKSSVLDADDIRNDFCKDLSFSLKDREENIRRIAYLAKYVENSGCIPIVAAITPLERFRTLTKEILGDNLIQVHIKCSLETCAKRDVKGLYGAAFKNKIKNFTGLSSPFEPPVYALLEVNTESNAKEECVQNILNFIKSRKLI